MTIVLAEALTGRRVFAAESGEDDRAAAVGRHLVLDTASLSVLGQEHDLPVVRHWNESYALVEAP
jgi:hypothetical protein